MESGAGVAQREVGDLATWSLSSCKLGFGITQLRDNQTTTYWQFVRQHRFVDSSGWVGSLLMHPILCCCFLA